MNLLLLGQHSSSSLVLLLLLAWTAFIKQGLAIKCYMCNSAPTRNDHMCASLSGDSTPFEQNCDHLPEVRANLTKYTVCRKMHQKIFDQKGNAEERIIRQCGTETPTGCTWRTRPNTLHVETCHCTTDLCNAAIGRAIDSRPLIGLLITWLGWALSDLLAVQNGQLCLKIGCWFRINQFIYL